MKIPNIMIINAIKVLIAMLDKDSEKSFGYDAIDFHYRIHIKKMEYTKRKEKPIFVIIDDYPNEKTGK